MRTLIATRLSVLLLAVVFLAVVATHPARATAAPQMPTPQPSSLSPRAHALVPDRATPAAAVTGAASSSPAGEDRPAVAVPQGLCGVLDSVCDKAAAVVPGAKIAEAGADALLSAKGVKGLDGIPNPMEALKDKVAKAAADAWTAAMLSVWQSGLFVLRIVLTFSEWFLTPDLRGDGPGKSVYEFTLWMALSLVLVLALIQLGTTVFRRDAKSLARAPVGAAQFVLVCACWFGYCSTIVAACGAISRSLMKSLLGVDSWPDWSPTAGISTQSITDATVATVLAGLGLVLWLAAIGHILIFLARAASLLILTATGPLSAAGLVSDGTKSWFWKSLRWFHAAAFTPVLMVMVLGLGVKMSTGVAPHLADSSQKAIGTALPSVMVILVGCVAPMALFKLLAFVDPGSPSGASFRQGMAAQGGIQGLLGAKSGGGSGAASQADGNGQSGGEQSAESSTGDRFSKSAQGGVGKLGAVGGALAAGTGMVSNLGAKATSLIGDETNQAGVGTNTYGPDFTGMGARTGGSGGHQGAHHPKDGNGPDSNGPGDPNDPDSNGSSGNSGADETQEMPVNPALPEPVAAAGGGGAPMGAPTPGQGPGGQGSAGGPECQGSGAGGSGASAGGAGGGASGAAAGGAAVPPVA